MNELQQKWVDALRSGDYAQGKSKLRDTEGRYCCWGVLCDLVDPDGWRGVEFHGKGSFYAPDEVVALVDMTYPTDRDFANMNDAGMSFEEIADKLEEYFENVD